jgi:hypothetical protein
MDEGTLLPKLFAFRWHRVAVQSTDAIRQHSRSDDIVDLLVVVGTRRNEEYQTVLSAFLVKNRTYDGDIWQVGTPH